MFATQPGFVGVVRFEPPKSSIADARLEHSSRWRAACRYRPERLFLNEKSTIARSTSIAARGCLPASASAAGVRISW